MILADSFWGPAAVPYHRAGWSSVKTGPVPWKVGQELLGLILSDASAKLFCTCLHSSFLSRCFFGLSSPPCIKHYSLTCWIKRGWKLKVTHLIENLFSISYCHHVSALVSAPSFRSHPRLLQCSLMGRGKLFPDSQMVLHPRARSGWTLGRWWASVWCQARSQAITHLKR